MLSPRCCHFVLPCGDGSISGWCVEIRWEPHRHINVSCERDKPMEENERRRRKILSRPRTHPHRLGIEEWALTNVVETDNAHVCWGRPKLAQTYVPRSGRFRVDEHFWDSWMRSHIFNYISDFRTTTVVGRDRKPARRGELTLQGSRKKLQVQNCTRLPFWLLVIYFFCSRFHHNCCKI